MGKIIRRGKTGKGLFSFRLFPVLFVLIFLVPVSLSARDFGLILNQSAGFGGAGNDTAFDYEAVFVPRFSMLIGDYGDLFLSASVKAAYENEEWSILPELLRNEFIWNFGGSDLHLGRMAFNDPMNIAAAGLFDGVRLSRHTMTGTFGVGLWYTGLLYRNRANIVMTSDDSAAMNEELDWGDFFNTYFASRRLITALYWDHPSFAELLRLNVALIGQVDLNGRDRAYHNQYLIAKVSFPYERFIIELGGALETAQAVNGGSADFYIALAGDIGFHWMPPADFHNMLSLTGRFTSGSAGSGGGSAFTPITAMSYGEILQAEIPGLSIISLSYTARLHRTFSVGLTASHFIRSDAETYTAYPLNGEPSDNYFLGTEFFGRFIWSPVSDVSLNLGAGAFLPSLGNVATDADTRWRVEMAVTLALR